ncbi:hypothetical protein Tco_0039666 [Tanacetum coccineum]
MLTKFMNTNTASTSGSGSLPSDTVANPRGDMKAITTRSGVSYDGPQVPPPPSSLPKVVEHEPEVTKDTVHPSTENIQPPEVQTQIDEPVVAPKTKPTIPYPSRINKEKLREKDDLLALKFMEIFQNLDFELSFTDALLHLPKFEPMFRKLLNNKDKILDLTKTLVNENFLAVIIQKFPEKLRELVRFLIPCDFLEMDECLALPDLGASINLMLLSVYYTDDPRVPLILGRPFLRMARALIDVHGEQMTLRHDDHSITIKVGDTKTFSYNIIESVNRVNDIDVACEEYAQEVLVFSNISKSGNPTPTLEPILSTSPPSLTLFEGEEQKFEELKIVGPSSDELPELELKDLPPHLEYAFLEDTDKLPVIIVKELKDEDKTALLKVLRSHKRAIAWKISDIKEIDPKFCTHKILMEDNVKPTVQHQRRVNPKIHEMFIDSQFTLDYESQMTDKYFAEYTRIKVRQFREALLQHMSNVKSLLLKEHVTKDLGHNLESMIQAAGQQHAEQPEFNNEGKVDQDVEHHQVKIPLLDPSLDNKTTEFSNQSLESENINQVVSKSSAVPTADASDKRQQQPDSTSSTSTLAITVTTDGNFDL